MPITISFEVRDTDDLRKSVDALGMMLNPPQASEKTLADFSYQEIADHWKMIQTSAGQTEEQPGFVPGGIIEIQPLPEANPEVVSEKAPAKTSKRAKAAVPADPVPETPAAKTPSKGSPAVSPEDTRQAAIKKVMDVYGVPLGKKLAGELLKEFGVRNFNLIPDDRAAELLSKVDAAIKAAGL